MGGMAILPSPSSLLEFGRTAVGQVLESAASLATVPVRVISLLSQAELLVSRITVVTEQAEALVQRIATVTAGAQDTVRESQAIAAAAASTVEEAAAVTISVTRVVDGAVATTNAVRAVVDEAATVAGAASAVVGAAGTATAEARDLLEGYSPTLRQAAPLAARFVDELSPDEITAAIRMVDTLPRLRQHLVDDVMPLLSKLDQVGPDLHKLLEVTEDLHLAITGLPGLKMLRRRGEDRIAEESA
jgi:hypothetical protein